jgi:hypothetical protein
VEEFAKDNKNITTKDAQKDIKQRLQAMKSFDLTGSPLNPFEQEGVRLAETYIDGHVMLILRELYAGIYDGYIAPRLFSPFHSNNVTHEEIVIFNPIESNMTLYKPPKPPKLLHLQDMLLKNSQLFTLSYKQMYDRKMFMNGGQHHLQSHPHPQDRNVFFDSINNNHIIKKAEKAAQRFAQRYTKNIHKPFNLGITKQPVIPQPKFLSCYDC